MSFKDFEAVKFNVAFTMGILGATEEENYCVGEIRKSVEEIKNLKGKEYGFPDFISHDTLFDDYESLIIGDSLTFFCDLSLVLIDDDYMSTSQVFVANFEKMFENEFLADFEFRTNDGKSFKAHKFILAARSPVIYSMLNTDMKESKENSLDIEDCDSVVLKEFLRFIYCQQLQATDEKIIHQLTYAAEKYGIEDLKVACIQNITLALSIKNVLKSLIIADCIPNKSNLFNECMNMIIK